MGDRYELDINCAYCNHLNKDVWYAPTCGSDTFKCRKCLKTNFITFDFRAKTVEEVSLLDVIEGFENTTIISRTDGETNKICNDRLKWIKAQKSSLRKVL